MRSRQYADAMKTLVIGAGGVGGYFGAQLARAGFDVTIAARGSHGRALSERGIAIKTSAHEQPEAHAQRIRFARVVASADELHERFELVLLAVKWPELEASCDALPNVIAVDGVVVPLLNGLTSEDVVASYVGAQRTVSGVAYMSAGIVEPGTIYVHGNTRLGLAPYRPGQDGELLRLVAAFTRAGIHVQTSEDHRAMLWQKMLWNAPFNGICALARKTAGQCADQMEPLVRSAMLEVIAVARAEGVLLPESLVDGMLAVTREQFPLTEPSMLQDVRKGRPTEVDILQGEVASRAARLGVPAPVLATLAALIRGLTGTLPTAPPPSVQP
jgi:2-dehydropantoate 2-reductase